MILKVTRQRNDGQCLSYRQESYTFRSVEKTIIWVGVEGGVGEEKGRVRNDVNTVLIQEILKENKIEKRIRITL